MRNGKERLEAMRAPEEPALRSPLDLWRLRGGVSHRPQEGETPPPDSMLACYGDRVTYTFIIDDEVASIHFDRRRGEIFFRGHNIRHLELTAAQVEALVRLEEVLKVDEKANDLFPEYSATLARCLADKYKGGRAPQGAPPEAG